MKRFVSGIVLLLIGLLAVLGASDQPNPVAVYSSGTLVLIGAALLTYFGWCNVANRKRVASAALRLLSEKGAIPADLLAQHSGLSEYRARRFLLELKKKGIIPFQAEVT